jgi:hypothetical protein
MNVLWKSIPCSLYELYGTREYIVWSQCRIYIVTRADVHWPLGAESLYSEILYVW